MPTQQESDMTQFIYEEIILDEKTLPTDYFSLESTLDSYEINYLHSPDLKPTTFLSAQAEQPLL